MDEAINETRIKMLKALDTLKTDLSTLRAGRASRSLVENLEVSVYGGAQKLKIVEVGTVVALDLHTLTITPWDQSIIGEVNKGILAANVGLSPVIDGSVIRISIPPMTEERRTELVHAMKQKLEGGKIMIRQVRHEAMTDLKKLEEKGEISEDEVKRLEKETQELTDQMIAEIDSLGRKKEEELMAV